MKNVLKKNKIELLLLAVVLLTLLTCLFDLKYLLEENELLFNFSNDVLRFIGIGGILVVLFIGCCYLLRKKKINENNLHKWFAVLALTFGGFYLFLSPFFTGSDEHNHFYRIYEISSGTLITPAKTVVGSYLPSSLNTTFSKGGGTNITIKYDKIEAMRSIQLDANEKKEYGKTWSNQYNNTALYSPVQYIPHVVGLKVGKIFTNSVYDLGIFSRLFNLIFYTIIATISIKILPKNKLFAFVILLCPVILQCATTLSADAFTLAIISLYISYLLKLYYSNDHYYWYDYIILLLLSVFISLCKIVYLPFIFFLCLLREKNCHKGKKEKWLYIIITVLISVITSLLWLNITGKYFDLAYPKSELQKSFILHNIIEYLIINVRTYYVNGLQFIENMFVGQEMYHSQVNIPSIFSIIYVMIVIVSILNDKVKNKVPNNFKYFIGFIIFMMMGLLDTALYVQCTAQFSGIALPKITGIQGRYFIPLLLPLILIFPEIKTKKQIPKEHVIEAVLAVHIIVYFYMMLQFII